MDRWSLEMASVKTYFFSGAAGLASGAGAGLMSSFGRAGTETGGVVTLIGAEVLISGLAGMVLGAAGVGDEPGAVGALVAGGTSSFTISLRFLSRLLTVYSDTS